MKIIARTDALAAGAKRYFTGTPCLRGHVAERLTSNKSCLTCCAQAPPTPATIANDAKRSADWYAQHREQELLRRRANYRANQEQRKLQNAAHRAERKPEQAARRRRHYEQNAARYKAQALARREHVRRATPPWADREAIISVYEHAARLSAETGVPHHVDHEIPLRGREVSGLHVPGNLRAIPAVANLSKSNRVGGK